MLTAFVYSPNGDNLAVWTGGESDLILRFASECRSGLGFSCVLFDSSSRVVREIVS